MMEAGKVLDGLSRAAAAALCGAQTKQALPHTVLSHSSE